MKRFAVVRMERSITGKQHIVLSAHLDFSVGLGICIAHWLCASQNQHHCSKLLFECFTTFLPYDKESTSAKHSTLKMQSYTAIIKL